MIAVPCRCDGWYARVNGTRSPAPTSKSQTVLKSWPCIRTGLVTFTVSGPAVAEMPQSVLWTHGTIEP